MILSLSFGCRNLTSPKPVPPSTPRRTTSMLNGGDSGPHGPAASVAVGKRNATTAATRPARATRDERLGFERMTGPPKARVGRGGRHSSLARGTLSGRPSRNLPGLTHDLGASRGLDLVDEPT